MIWVITPDTFIASPRVADLDAYLGSVLGRSQYLVICQLPLPPQKGHLSRSDTCDCKHCTAS
jgi:hypothetical protein